ncbi:hypothetical protein ABZ725_37840 [Streptomyces sp. NPDC006872]
MAISTEAHGVAVDDARSVIWSYGASINLIRLDLQLREQGRPSTW